MTCTRISHTMYPLIHCGLSIMYITIEKMASKEKTQCSGSEACVHTSVTNHFMSYLFDSCYHIFLSYPVMAKKLLVNLSFLFGTICSLYYTPASLAVACSNMQCRYSNLILWNVTAQETVVDCIVTSCTYGSYGNGMILTVFFPNFICFASFLYY